MDDEETLTAYHEAGHAVIGYALGGVVDSLQLGGEADDQLPRRFGECRIRWGRVDPHRRLASATRSSNGPGRSRC